MSRYEMKFIRWKRAALRLRTSDVIVRMSKRERGKYRGLLSGPPGEPEPENQRNQNRTRNTKRGQPAQTRLLGMFGSLWHQLRGRRLKYP
jgi:hypothetical protein